MIEKEVSHVRGREVCKAAGYGTRALGVLMRICQVNAGAVEEFRRADGGFPAADAGVIDREWKKNIRVSQNVVVEKIPRGRMEIVFVERPAAEGDRDAYFPLFIAFAVERKEAKAGLEQILGNCIERRSLVVASVESPQYGIQLRNANRGSDARVGGIFVHQTVEMRESNATVESKPGCRLVLVFEKDSLEVAPDDLGLCLGSAAAVLVVRGDTEKGIVVLSVDVQSTAKTVLTLDDRK